MHIARAKAPCRGRSVFGGGKKQFPVPDWLRPIDGYHAAGTDPDNSARVTLEFIQRHSQ